MPIHFWLLQFLLLISILKLQISNSAGITATTSPESSAIYTFLSNIDPSNHLKFPFSSPCIYPTIECQKNPNKTNIIIITRLVLESANLTGTIPASSLSLLTNLRVLSLKSNSLSGSLPDISDLTNLKAVYLSGNRFSGPFPPSLLSLRRLRSLDISDNLFFGNIPPSITTALPRIVLFRLDTNRFVGSVPAFNQSTLKLLNVSFNRLSGPIPATLVLSALGPAAFIGNPGLCGEIVRRECHLSFFGFGPAAAPSSPKTAAGVDSNDPRRENFFLPDSSAPKSRKLRRQAAVVIAVSVGAFMAILLACVLAASKRIRKNKGKMMSSPEYPSPKKSAAAASDLSRENESSNANNYVISATAEETAAMMLPEEKARRLEKSGCLVFCAGEDAGYSLEQLMRASAEVLGRGCVGTTYKAVLDGRLVVIVKRIDAAKIGPVALEAEAFERHMEVVGRLRHPNLVPLRAYFQAKEERLLVYDYQPNGSLYSLIHGSRSSRANPLHWTSCLKIAGDVAQGLAYIHQASRLVHGNIKSSNILLGQEFEACLTDNCLSFLLEPSEIAEDSGYKAPETMKSRRLTPRSDIYAFGVLLLELLSGKPPMQHSVLVATNLQTWVRSEREDEGADNERLMMIVDVAAACVKSSPESRPTAWQVLKMIQVVKDADNGDNDSDLTSN